MKIEFIFRTLWQAIYQPKPFNKQTPEQPKTNVASGVDYRPTKTNDDYKRHKMIN